MFTRYTFFSIFAINAVTQDIYPLYNTTVNGKFYQKNVSIPKGLSFGGINIYQYISRDFGGTWNDVTKTLNLTTAY